MKVYIKWGYILKKCFKLSYTESHLPVNDKAIWEALICISFQSVCHVVIISVILHTAESSLIASHSQMLWNISLLSSLSNAFWKFTKFGKGKSLMVWLCWFLISSWLLCMLPGALDQLWTGFQRDASEHWGCEWHSFNQGCSFWDVRQLQKTGKRCDFFKKLETRALGGFRRTILQKYPKCPLVLQYAKNKNFKTVILWIYIHHSF